MKRIVKAATYSKRETIEMQLDNLDTYNCGYDLKVTSDSGDFKLEPRKDKDMMPKFKVISFTQDDGTVLYDVELSFPNIYLGEDQYADTAEYWLGVWMGAAQLATQIKKLRVDPNEQYEE